MRPMSFPSAVTLVAAAAVILSTGCAGRKMVMEVSATILYERPKIAEVTHLLQDRRPEGGAAIVEVTMLGDPGLAATFDIQPGVVESRAMRETADGRYFGSFQFPPEAAGGPYTILVRLRHEAAGEVTARDPELVTIPLAEPAPEP